MGVFNHAQRSFAAGELSPRVHGQFGTELYEKALALCENWQPLPQGSLRMRAGTSYDGSTATKPRLIPFNVSGGNPYTLVLEDAKLSIYDNDGVKQTFRPNLVANGSFDAGKDGWYDPYNYLTWQSGGYVSIPTGNTARLSGFVLTPGHEHTLRIRARGASQVRVHYFTSGGLVTQGLDVTTDVSAQWNEYSFTFTPPGAGDILDIIATGAALDLDDVVVTDNAVAAADHFDAPWSAAQLPAIQYDQDLTKNRMLLVHPNVQPRLLAISVHGTWEFKTAPFLDPPSTWGSDNWPACVDWGFQGRLWLGGEPDEPNVFRGSYSGQPFKFTSGGSTAADSVSFAASVRGALRWLQGQKVLLLGAERVEQSASGGSTVIAPGNIDVRDESAFGSAAIQAVHIGDQALWVTRDLRHIRAMDFDLQKDGWVSRALTFLAEHLTEGGLKEIAFARAPDPTIFGLRAADGMVIGCTYDRAEQVLAFWRMPLAGAAPVNSMCVVDAPDGCELRLAVTRPGGEYLERLPLHEVGVSYVDSGKSGVVAGDGTFAGLDHLEGQQVRVIVAGALRADRVVAGGKVAVDVADAGSSIVVGLAYRPSGKTLKPEGGNPRGTAQGTKRHRPKVYLRVNDSALPLVNEERPDGAPPLVGLDTAAGRVSGDFEYPGIDYEEDGQVTFEQDLPFRTEILAIFGPVQVNDV